MTETSYPWIGTAVGDAGPYSSDQWATLQRAFGGSGSDFDAGPLTGYGQNNNPDPGLTVTQRGTGANMSVDVSQGSAINLGTFYRNTATLNLAIAANASGNPRIDTVVLNKDWVAQTVRLVVVQGTPAATPVPPGLTQSNLVQWQIPIGDVAVANGAVSITNANITSRARPFNASDGVYLFGVLNNSGVVLQTGDVVVLDTSADRAAKTSTTANDPLTLGVWVGRTAIGAYGRVLVSGVGYVNSNAAVTRGQSLVQSTSAKQAAPVTLNSQPFSIGAALQTTTGAGLVVCEVNTLGGIGNYLFNGRVIGTATANLVATTSSATFVDTDAANAIVTHQNYSGRVLIIVMLPVLSPTTQTLFLDVIVDSTTRVSGSAAGGNGITSPGITGGTAVIAINTFAYMAQGIAGNHTYKVQWRTSGGTQTCQGTFRMWVIEI